MIIIRRGVTFPGTLAAAELLLQYSRLPARHSILIIMTTTFLVMMMMMTLLVMMLIVIIEATDRNLKMDIEQIRSCAT